MIGAIGFPVEKLPTDGREKNHHSETNPFFGLIVILLFCTVYDERDDNILKMSKSLLVH